ncbi:MAG: hypothetical protein JRJ79_11915 [Deltaproteobacteria bacterium]|nr:hypothetical protein [Deltaproteobacteria bacterium]MBW2339384.1 hypothetical protein [Deltaproteobacteria bacterium]
MHKNIVIVSAVRTPFGRYCGSLREYDYFDLGALPMKEVLARVNVPGDKVDEVFWGVGICCEVRQEYRSAGTYHFACTADIAFCVEARIVLGGNLLRAFGN